MRGNARIVLAGALRDARRATATWTLAVAAIAVFYLSFYPMIGGAQMADMMNMMPQGLLDALGMQDIATAAGYANATVYTLLGLVILLIFAITSGARAIGGAEETGVLELEYATPTSRAQLYGGQLAALWVKVCVAALGVTIAVFALNLIASLEISNANIWLMGPALALIVGAFGTIALAFGASSGQRAVGLGVAAGIAVVGYLLNVVGSAASIGWMNAISPFGWYAGNTPLVNGLCLSGMGWLVLLAAIPGVWGWVALRRRDLMVHRA